MRLCITLILAGSSSSLAQTCAAAPPTTDAPAGCKFSCAGAISASFDLTAFQKAMPPIGYYHATDSQNHDYYLSGCGPITAVTCDASQVKSAASIQSWGSQPPHMTGLCAAAGDFTTQSCTVAAGGPAPPAPPGPAWRRALQAPAPAKPELTCKYTNGDGSRALSVLYKCSPVAVAPTAAQDPKSQTQYDIVFAGPGGCPGGSSGTSGGTLFMILFPVFVVVYLGAGIGYNIKVNGLAGKEAIPQLEYWKQLPGLVKDGCKFSHKTAVATYESLSGRGTSNNSLKEGLNEEDGLTAAQNDT